MGGAPPGGGPGCPECPLGCMGKEVGPRGCMGPAIPLAMVGVNPSPGLGGIGMPFGSLVDCDCIGGCGCWPIGICCRGGGIRCWVA